MPAWRPLLTRPVSLQSLSQTTTRAYEQQLHHSTLTSVHPDFDSIPARDACPPNGHWANSGQAMCRLAVSQTLGRVLLANRTSSAGHAGTCDDHAHLSDVPQRPDGIAEPLLPHEPPSLKAATLLEFSHLPGNERTDQGCQARSHAAHHGQTSSRRESHRRTPLPA